MLGDSRGALCWQEGRSLSVTLATLPLGCISLGPWGVSAPGVSATSGHQPALAEGARGRRQLQGSC